MFKNRTIDNFNKVNVKKKEETTLTKGKVDDRIENVLKETKSFLKKFEKKFKKLLTNKNKNDKI